jgi:hypothetical protein
MNKFHRLAFAAAAAMVYRNAEPGTDGSAPAAAETAKPAAPAKIIAHGVTRPADGTKTGRVWAIADELSKALGKPVPRADVMKKGEAESINSATIATQYGKWRVFNGLKGVTTSEPKPPKAKKSKAAQAPADAAQVEGTAAPAGTPAA